MLNEQDYCNELRNNSNFAKSENYTDIRSIIEATSKTIKHNMVKSEDYFLPFEVYEEIAPLEYADLIDYLEFENQDGRNHKKR